MESYTNEYTELQLFDLDTLAEAYEYIDENDLQSTEERGDR